MALAVLITALVGAFYQPKVKSSAQSQKGNSQNQSAVSSQVPQPTFDTSSWSSYRDTNYNFSLKYPSVLTPKAENHEPYGEQILFNQAKDGTPKLVITVYSYILGGMIDQDFDKIYNLTAGDSIEINNKVIGHQKLTKINNRMINGFEAFDYKRNSLPINPDNPEVGVGVYVNLGQYILLLEAGEGDRAVIDSVVSTVASQK